MSESLSNETLDDVFSENEAIYEKMRDIFTEYHKLFSDERELEIKKLTIDYLLQIDPDNEEYLIDKYQLEGRDYLAEKAIAEKLRLEQEEKIRILKEAKESEDKIQKEIFELKRKDLLNQMEGKTFKEKIILEQELSKLQDKFPISEEELERRKALWEERNKDNPRWVSRIWLFKEEN